MINDDDKTKPLYDLEDLNRIYDMNSENTSNKEETLESITPIKEEKKKLTLKQKWNKIPKKTRIVIVVGIILLIVLIVCLVIFFLNKNKKEDTPEKEVVIVEKDNYRYEDGKLVFINSNNEDIGEYECTNKSEDNCYIAYFSNEDEFDIDTIYDSNNLKYEYSSEIINDKYVFIKDVSKSTDTSIYLYDMETKEIVDTYYLIKKVYNDSNKIIVKDVNNLYGVLDFSSDTVSTLITPSYDYLASLSTIEGFVSTSNSRNIILSANGDNISKVVDGTIKNVTTSYITTIIDGKYAVYDYNGKKIFDSFDFIETYDNYAVLISDNKLYLKYYDGVKLLEDGIDLYNKDYVKSTYLDEDGTVKETKECFYLEENNDIITVTVVKDTITETHTINQAEASISKTLNYVSYFDGVLYFYLDSNKTELLGSYTCSNKNNVTSSTTSLDNCFVASDTTYEDNDVELSSNVGIIPIFNERYVFISDNPDLVNEENATVVLYDLKKSSQIGKYISVNTYSYTGSQSISFSTVNDLQVVAKNKSNKYGVIKINLSSVNGHISFNYDSLEKIGDCYIAKDSTGYLLINASDGKSLTSAIPYKIRNYNTTSEYVTVINENKYYIYSFQAKKLVEKGYTYIELYDKFFATVDDNNKLHLYTYDSTSTDLLDAIDTTLELTNYYKNGTKAFKISVNGNNYEVFKGSSDGKYTSIYEGTLKESDD